MKRLGLKPYSKEWTISDDIKLRELVCIYDIVDICYKMEKSESSIKQHAEALGLKLLEVFPFIYTVSIGTSLIGILSTLVSSNIFVSNSNRSP